MPECRCVDCGFLALFNHTTREFHETDAYVRETGDVRPIFDKAPRCFARAANLREEMVESPGRNDRAKFIALIKSPRKCPKFLEWQQGFSPKEHMEMLHEQLMREWQERQEEKARAFQQGQARWYMIVTLVAAFISGGLGWCLARWAQSPPTQQAAPATKP